MPFIVDLGTVLISNSVTSSKRTFGHDFVRRREHTGTLELAAPAPTHFLYIFTLNFPAQHPPSHSTLPTSQPTQSHDIVELRTQQADHNSASKLPIHPHTGSSNVLLYPRVLIQSVG
jgi:hypothetical protein